MDKLYKDKNWLYRQYWIKQLSLPKISRLCNISIPAIVYWMDKFKIKRRTISQSISGKLNPIKGKKLTEKEKKHLSKIKIQYFHKKFGHQEYRNRTWLYQKYIIEELSATDIGKLCNVTTRPVYTWLNKFNIPISNVIGHRDTYALLGQTKKKDCPGKKFSIVALKNYIRESAYV